MPLRGGITAGKNCAVPSCTNCWGKIKIWKNQPCEIHMGQSRSECQCCPQPYSLHCFPRRDKPGRRNSWLQLLGRKNFVPTDSSRICSVHFVDGKPTPENPDPVLYMGGSGPGQSSQATLSKPIKRRSTANSSKADNLYPSVSSMAGGAGVMLSAKSKAIPNAKVPVAVAKEGTGVEEVCFLCQKSEPALPKFQGGRRKEPKVKVEHVLGLLRILLRNKTKTKILEETSLEHELMELDYCSNCITELEDIYTHLQQLDQLIQLLWIQKTKIIDKLRVGSCKTKSAAAAADPMNVKSQGQEEDDIQFSGKSSSKGQILRERIIQEIELEESQIVASGTPKSKHAVNWACDEENLDWSLPIVKLEELENLEHFPAPADPPEEEEIKVEIFDEGEEKQKGGGPWRWPEEGPPEVDTSYSNSALPLNDDSPTAPCSSSPLPPFNNVPVIVLPTVPTPATETTPVGSTDAEQNQIVLPQLFFLVPAPKPQLFHCDQCTTFSAPTPHRLKVHVTQVHSKLRPFSCHFCPWKFKSRTELRVHEARHEGKDQDKFLCSACPKTFPTKARLRTHEAGVHKTCGGTGVSSSSSGTGTGTGSTGTGGDGRQQFICDICGKGFPISNYLYYHRKTHDTPEEKKARKLKAKLVAEERKAAGLPTSRRLEKKTSSSLNAGGTGATE